MGRQWQRWYGLLGILVWTAVCSVMCDVVYLWALMHWQHGVDGRCTCSRDHES